LNFSVPGTYHPKKIRKLKGFLPGIKSSIFAHHLDPAIHGNPASIEVDEDRYERRYDFHFWKRQLERGRGKRGKGKSPE
jgi:hypothetical protein